MTGSTDNQDKTEKNGVLLAQLTQLNERARVYTAQQWQVPFAYVAIVGVALGSLVNGEAPQDAVKWLLLAAGGIGVLVRWHMWFNRGGAMRAVCWIQKVEEKLQFKNKVGLGEKSGPAEGEKNSTTICGKLGKLLYKLCRATGKKDYSARYRKWAFVPLEAMVTSVAVACLLGGAEWRGIGSGCTADWVWRLIVVIGVVAVVEGFSLVCAWLRWKAFCKKLNI